MSEPLIRVENLAKIYRSGTTDLVVFSGVHFELWRGESVALMGESGTGKSTLLHLLGALDVPSEGEIYYQGRALSAFTAGELDEFRNRETGYVWQSYHLLPEFSAVENVMMPLLIGGAPPQQAEPAARHWLAQVGLADRASHQAGELSGGEQQRVAIARALVASPKVLLADEPTGNLDEGSAGAVIQLIVELTRSQALTTIIATHNVKFANLCDRALRIQSRQVIPLEASV